MRGRGPASAWRGATPTSPPARWIQFRIGINLGDVIVEGDDIFGDGVNVAARLEALAEPGGICVSAARARSGRRPARDVAFEDLGEQTVKNIAGPMRVFRDRARAATPQHRAPAGAQRRRGDRGDRRQAVDRRAAVRQHERRSGAGVLRRRPDRGHHHRAVALPRAARDLAQLGVRAQGQGGQGAGGRARIRRRIRGRRAACARPATGSASPSS